MGTELQLEGISGEIRAAIGALEVELTIYVFEDYFRSKEYFFIHAVVDD